MTLLISDSKPYSHLISVLQVESHGATVIRLTFLCSFSTSWTFDRVGSVVLWFGCKSMVPVKAQVSGAGGQEILLRSSGIPGKARAVIEAPRLPTQIATK